MSQACEVVIVADDLSGALDAAAPFAQHGMATRVAVTLEGLDAALSTSRRIPQVVAVNTGSRHLDRAGAARRAAQAAERLLEHRPKLLIKKIDSTLRGQVVDESVALRRLGEPRRLLVCPAVPSQGRLVRGAEVWVDGEPLSATAYARDALSPALAGPLDSAFEAEGIALERYDPDACRHGAAPLLPTTDCVADASDDAALARMADQLLEAAREWLPVCAAGLTRALAHRLAAAQDRAATPRPLSLPEPSRLLLAVGSRAPRARRQLERLREAFPDIPWLPVFGTGHDDAEQRMRVIVPGVSAGETPSAEAVAAGMAAAVAAAGGEAHDTLLFLSGGDIALAVLERLHADFIDLKGEWVSGVPLGNVNGDARRPVMTKAGGFGPEELLVRLVEGIRHSSRA
ncbi:four-carbon acid sugar kinase family protein [Billgrantia sp. LNSP4103-1]|uniref:four-carbon acid sugar kinase family protein n=1 Tax=Billgrantia sp. LNSP4103-1 TaxID=3410266 RepID=UPI00403F4A67